eukprot:COSAG04_NODE_1397_length_6930_cov_2.619236_8_plen_439_part_01
MSAEKVTEKEKRDCWVCLDDGPDESGALPSPTGCACRGGATTHAHVACLATFAREKKATWVRCPTCGQGWSGPVALALSRRRHELVAGLPEEDGERLAAAINLAEALRVAGQYEEALHLGRANLAIIHRLYGPENLDTLHAMESLAAAHGESGDLEAALPLFTELVATSRRVRGAEHEGTLYAMNNLAATHARMGNPDLALPLYQEAVDARRRMLGDGDAHTLQAIGNLAGTYQRLHEHERALPLMKEAVEGCRRVLGGQHPDTLLEVGHLGVLLYNMGSHAAAASLLEEAVEGLSALSLGGFHLQQLQHLKGVLEENACCVAKPAAAAQLQRNIRQQRLEVEASLPTAAATVVGVQSRPELNGAEVTIRRFLIDKDRYTVQLPPDDAGKQEQINLKPANLVLAEGSAVVATGLTGAPELNGQRGIVEGWLEEKGRYAV